MRIGTAVTPLRYEAAKESALEEGGGEIICEGRKVWGSPELTGGGGNGAGTVAS